MNTIEQAMQYLLLGALILLAVMVCFCLVRTFKGPRITDRIIAINMIGTMTIITICVLAVYMKESYLIDVALVYAMISFLSVIVLCKVYTGVYLERKKKEAEEEERGKEKKEC